ncbi:hypothetical protein [Halobellus marinus]|uniref:hypothetical protein n=1 Tax=Halobellus TaxID=1073986 RepID=UPI0028ABB86C|nr:hypothetical protein [Halobellus sp. DFY28]
MDCEKKKHTYSVSEYTHYVPARYWLNKHFWFEDYERVEDLFERQERGELNLDILDTDNHTILEVRFDINQTPNESKWNPDGRSIWLSIRADYETDFPSDNPHYAPTLEECSVGDMYLTKTETILNHLGYDYDTHEVIAVRTAEDKDGVYVTVRERLNHPTKLE